jgi:hypothetical protein
MIREKILDYLTTTEAHKVGILYIVLAVINLILAGLMAFIIRLTIATTPPATNAASAGLITNPKRPDGVESVEGCAHYVDVIWALFAASYAGPPPAVAHA